MLPRCQTTVASSARQVSNSLTETRLDMCRQRRTLLPVGGPPSTGCASAAWCGRMNEWQKKCTENALMRAAAAESASADRAALIREAVRLSGGDTLTLPASLSTAGLDAQRFGLAIESGPAGSIARIVRWVPDRDVPMDLADELLSVLRVDPDKRRVDSSAAPDGVLLRNTPFVEYRNITQKAAVRAALTMPPAATLLVRMSTGTGKSLLFQLAAMFEREKYEYATVAVLVPTIALALDQARGAEAFDRLKGTCALTSQDSLQEREAKLTRFAQGAVPILFLSPEMALGAAWPHLVLTALPLNAPSRPIAGRARLVSIFVDEAHIVASWGKSFRPDLQRIPGLVRALRQGAPELRTVLLSATVDASTRTLLLEQYAPDRRAGETFLEIVEGAPRTEFDLVAHGFDTADARRRALMALVDYLPRPALIYMTQVEDAKALGQRLSSDGGYRRVAVFTGETSGPERHKIINDWRDGKIDLVVGTSAFGMGIDKSDVRVVVHACVPEGASRYYQEIGRAGRDGHQALALLLHAPEDERLAVRLAIGQVLNEAAAPRWRDMIAHRRLSPMSEIAGVAWELDIGLPNRCSYDVRWNCALLVQLQRYGAIDVLVGADDVDDRRETWTVTSREPYHAIFDTDAVDSEFEVLFGKRQLEEATALAEVREFLQVWQGHTCILRALYRLVEANAPRIKRCCKCQECRRQGGSPESTDAGSKQFRRWKSVIRRRWYPRVLYVRSTEELDTALTRSKSKLKVLHLIGPRWLAGTMARSAALHEFNWFTTWEEMRAGVLVPEDAASLFVDLGNPVRDAENFSELSTWHDTDGHLKWVIGLPTTRVDGRTLEDAASNVAAIWLTSL